MDQIGLLDAAKQHMGLTSDNQLALRLGITRMRVSDLRNGRKPMDEAEIFMLAEMAAIDPRAAAAAARKDREKNPAKRAYWEKISLQFAVILLAVFAVVLPMKSEAKESVVAKQTTCYKLCEVHPIFMGWFTRFIEAIIEGLSLNRKHVNA